ncbi:MAG TPA: tetratricopeptide repeat protein [Candidatus Polarisedimenticolia bacterium]|jgi:tetratricopeptide (TPR) repeat protein
MKPSGLIAPGAPLPPPHRAALVLLFALVAVLSLRQVGSIDTGFHLKAGEHLLSGGGWPRTDPFTFTINDHPYIDTSWGYQVVLALIQGRFDAPGLVLFHAALALAVFLVLYRTARLAPVDSTTLVTLFALGAVACEMRFEARPELASWLFLALTLHILHRRAVGLAASLPALAALHLVWANTHGLFVLGWGAIACFVIGDWIRQRRFDRHLMAWGLASVAVTLVNPYGWRGALFPFTLATRLRGENLFGQSIGEFVSPFDLGLSSQFPFYPRLPIHAFQLLAVLAVVALVPLLRRKRYECALVLIPFWALASMMIRNIPLLVVAGLAPLAWGAPLSGLMAAMRLRARTREIAARFAASAVALAAIVLGLRVYHDAYYIASRRADRFGVSWNHLILPIDAARYADKVGLDGPMLNHLNFGGYLMWARPQRVFIDGRLEVAGEEFYKDYQNVLANEGDMEACVARFGIEWIVFPYDTNPKLLGRLSKDARWRLAYADHLAAIFVRDGPLAGRFVDPALALEAGAPPPDDLLPGIGALPRVSRLTRWARGLVRVEEFPFDDFHRGLFHFFRGDLARAQRSFASAALASSGAYYEIYSDLGAVYYRQGRFAQAAGCYRVVLRDDPGNKVAKERLASMPAPPPGGPTR